jgi:hypothetical protein
MGFKGLNVWLCICVYISITPVSDKNETFLKLAQSPLCLEAKLECDTSQPVALIWRQLVQNKRPLEKQPDNDSDCYLRNSSPPHFNC